ncbi:Uncharacterized protein HZ326_16674 [Fusarium oxysporum f. sp. albedinis]|nr:Uncharacterized protein HZ326_16674 [Fusarium oxysporum f. sp. albedinis]
MFYESHIHHVSHYPLLPCNITMIPKLDHATISAVSPGISLERMKDVTRGSLGVSIFLPAFGGILGEFAFYRHHCQLSIHDIGFLILQHPISSLDSLDLLMASPSKSSAGAASTAAL